MAGYLLSILSHLTAGVAQTPLVLAISRMIMGTGSALTLTAGTVYVTEIATDSTRTRDLGRFQSTLSLDGIVGPTLGDLISDHLGIRTIFFISAGISCLGVVLVYRIQSRPDDDVPVVKTAQNLGVIREIVSERRMILLSVSCFMMFFLFSSIRGTMIPVYGIEELLLSSFEIEMV